jgi:glycosyltransferase involved in cell wall biosynthesis
MMRKFLVRKMERSKSKVVLMLCFAHSIRDGRVFFRECQALMKAGWTVRMVARPSPVDSNEKSFPLLSVRILPARPQSIIGRILLDPFHFAIFFLFALKLSYGVSVIHCHEYQSLKAGRWIALFRHAKLVYDCHEYQPESLADIFFGWSTVVRKWTCRFFMRMERWSTAGVDAVVTVNNDLAARFRRFCKRVVVLPNYPDNDCVERSADPPQDIKTRCDGKRVLVFCGYLAPDRGLEQCVRSLAFLKDKCPDLILLLAGGAGEMYKNKLIDVASAAGVLDRVVLTGYVSHENLPGYLALGDIGMNLIEPFEKNLRAEQTKCFQYAAAELPVVLTDLPALKKLAKDMGNGVIVPANDTRATVDAVFSLLSHPERMKEMGARGGRAFLSAYNFQAVSGRLIDLYDELTRS